MGPQVSAKAQKVPTVPVPLRCPGDVVAYSRFEGVRSNAFPYTEDGHCLGCCLEVLGVTGNSRQESGR